MKQESRQEHNYEEIQESKNSVSFVWQNVFFSKVKLKSNFFLVNMNPPVLSQFSFNLNYSYMCSPKGDSDSKSSFHYQHSCKHRVCVYDSAIMITCFISQSSSSYGCLEHSHAVDLCLFSQSVKYKLILHIGISWLSSG